MDHEMSVEAKVGVPDIPAAIRSLRSFDRSTNTYQPASLAEFAALVAADLATPSARSSGRPWTLELGVEELVAVLRCLDELAAVHAHTALSEVLTRYTTGLRQRLDTARLGPQPSPAPSEANHPESDTVRLRP